MFDLREAIGDYRKQYSPLLEVVGAVGFTGAGNVVNLLLQRVLLFPLLLRCFGSAVFGSFVIVHSLVNIIGFAPTASLNLAYYRNYQHTDPGERSLLAGNAFLFAVGVGICLSLLFYLQRFRLMSIFNSQEVGSFVPGMSVFLLSLCIMWALDGQLSLNLAFKLRAVSQIGLGVLMLMAVPLTKVDKFWGPSIGMAVSASTVGLSMLLYLTWRRAIEIRIRLLSKFRELAPAGGAYFVNTLAQMSFQYADRLILGIYQNKELVTIYFAASTVAVLVFMPLSVCSSVLIPFMSSGKIVMKDSRSLFRYYAVVAILSMGSILAGWGLGSMLLRMLYGDRIGIAAQQAFSILLLGQAVYMLQYFTRPLLPIFFSLRLQMAIDIVGASLLVALLFSFAPGQGLMGTAVSRSIAGCILGVLYAGAGFIVVTKGHVGYLYGNGSERL